MRRAKLGNKRQVEGFDLAGTAFLPWEKWFAWLVHKLAVAIRRRSHRIQRQRSLSHTKAGVRSRALLRVSTGTFPILERKSFISYLKPQGYRSGSFWHWFDSATPRQVRVGDRIVLRFNPSNGEESVFLQFSRWLV